MTKSLKITEYKKPLNIAFKPSSYKTVDDIKNVFGKKVVSSAPHIKRTDEEVVFPGWIIREMVQKFNGCLLICIDGQYRFLMPSWSGYTVFETWPDYPSVKVCIFDGYWTVL